MFLGKTNQLQFQVAVFLVDLAAVVLEVKVQLLIIFCVFQVSLAQFIDLNLLVLDH